MYSVKEIYYTLQGEGAQAGRAAVFLRFAGCNLWTGREEDREKATCKFCDTQFVGTDGENGGKFKHPVELARRVRDIWDTGAHGHWSGEAKPYVVCTGGEPLLQLNLLLVDCLHQQGFEVAVETNGTQNAKGLMLDWVCVSPKAGSELKQVTGNELKLVYPQPENHPSQFEKMAFDHFFLSPKNDPVYGLSTENMVKAISYCMQNPQWRLSMQQHKIWELK